jgi:hypothetical protein
MKNIFPALVFFISIAGGMKNILPELKRGPLGHNLLLER